jgi:hypothetical protein
MKLRVDMDDHSALIIAQLARRNIQGSYYSTKKEASDALLAIIPLDATVGISGSMTLKELGIVSALEVRGTPVYNQNKEGVSREESLALRKQGVQAQYYLASANAIAETGEMVFISAYGNRTAGIAYADNAIIICGRNKIVQTLPEALSRSRKYVTPRNCKRLDWPAPCRSTGVCEDDACRFPEYRRMCCQLLIIEGEIVPGRMRVVLVGEDLGY